MSSGPLPGLSCLVAGARRVKTVFVAELASGYGFTDAITGLSL